MQDEWGTPHAKLGECFAANMLAMIGVGFVIAFFARGRTTRQSQAGAIPINP
jgi:hypothetical protein